jgi:hypothetical protein
MKQALFIGIFIISLCSCKKNSPDSRVLDYNDLNGTWIMISFKDNVTGIISPKPANLTNSLSDPSITLVVRDSNYVNFPDGNSLLNWIGNGGFSISNNKTIANFKCGITYVMEPEWGLQFIMQLPATNRYFFTDIDHLCFVTSFNTTLNFKRK